MRDAGNYGTEQPYDMEKMLKALEAEGRDFLVFGGEPLLVPLADLERIWAWGYGRYKTNGVQTNGVLITPEHVKIFKKYNVHVGFSLDGPDELNDSRWAGTVERTREATAKSHANLRAVIAAGVRQSLIVTLYRGNASAERLPRLLAWLAELDQLGVQHARIHLLEVDHPSVATRMALTPEENLTALRAIVALERTLEKMRFDILTDMRNLLAAEDEQVTCTWTACDPYTTSAVRGVDGQGNRSNCGRTNKDGIARLKAEQAGYARQVILYHTPQKDGGCQGCRFFLMCKGQCPGTAINGDWRNRSEQCPVWFGLFEELEAEFVADNRVPLSLAEDRVVLEGAIVNAWARGKRVTLKSARSRLRRGVAAMSVGEDEGHGDIPHGDEHEDHWDGP
jgi:uncharacterized protein